MTPLMPVSMAGFHPSPAFDHGIAGFLRALARHRDGLHGFGLERLGIEALVLEPQIYGTGVAEERDALLVLDDGDALNVICVAVPGVFVIAFSAVGGMSSLESSDMVSPLNFPSSSIRELACRIT